jgi:hypothetical protein
MGTSQRRRVAPYSNVLLVISTPRDRDAVSVDYLFAAQVINHKDNGGERNTRNQTNAHGVGNPILDKGNRCKRETGGHQQRKSRKHADGERAE